jgi:hypothetical protein
MFGNNTVTPQTWGDDLASFAKHPESLRQTASFVRMNFDRTRKSLKKDRLIRRQLVDS